MPTGYNSQNHILEERYRGRKLLSIEANFMVADLGKSADLQRVAETISADSSVSMLVNNAGTASLVPSVAIPLADLDAQLNVNARAVSSPAWIQQARRGHHH